MKLGLRGGCSNLAGVSGARFGNPMEVGVTCLKKGSSSAGAGISEGAPWWGRVRNPDPEPAGPGINCHRWDETLAGQHFQKQQVNRKKKPPLPPLALQSVDIAQQGSGWQRRSEGFRVPAQCQEAESRGVGLELKTIAEKPARLALYTDPWPFPALLGSWLPDSLPVYKLASVLELGILSHLCSSNLWGSLLN